jgi:hypothetical protein
VIRRLLALVSGIPPADLDPRTLRRLEWVFVAACAAATAVFVVVLVARH